MLYYCNMVRWTWWDWSGAWSLDHYFLQCFDAVGWVIWPIKIRPRYDLWCVKWDVKSCSINQSYRWQLLVLGGFQIGPQKGRSFPQKKWKLQSMLVNLRSQSSADMINTMLCFCIAVVESTSTALAELLLAFRSFWCTFLKQWRL